jgi:hypothetical protein
MCVLSRVRNGVFVLLMLITAYAFEARLLAVMGGALNQACQNWDEGEGWECTSCSLNQGFPPEWEASGNCDFSGVEPEEDRLQLAAAYCQDITFAFDDTCENEYPAYLADYYNWSLPSSHPCFSAATNPSCWFTWANASCLAGANSTWGGDCDRWLVCDCDD